MHDFWQLPAIPVLGVAENPGKGVNAGKRGNPGRASAGGSPGELMVGPSQFPKEAHAARENLSRASGGSSTDFGCDNIFNFFGVNNQ
ncbi:MAG: hypothetical protein ACKOGA_23700 [Planctomycetaceae bacterium]